MSKRRYRSTRASRFPACTPGLERQLRQLEIRDVALGELKPNPRNPKTHSAKQIGQIAASIREFGFCNPVLADEQDRIIAGHGRLEAARLLSRSSGSPG